MVEETTETPETPEEETPEEEASPSETTEEEKETPEKPAEEEHSPEEKKLHARLVKQQKKNRELIKQLREKDKTQAATPANDEKSTENSAEKYLSDLLDKKLEQREQREQAVEKAEDNDYQEMLDEFTDLDPNFDEKKFSQMVVKYKPSDRDAAWELWQNLKDSASPSKEKPKMPSGNKTTDEVKTKQYIPGKGKKVHQVLAEAIKEHGLDE